MQNDGDEWQCQTEGVPAGLKLAGLEEVTRRDHMSRADLGQSRCVV